MRCADGHCCYRYALARYSTVLYRYCDCWIAPTGTRRTSTVQLCRLAVYGALFAAIGADRDRSGCVHMPLGVLQR